MNTGSRNVSESRAGVPLFNIALGAWLFLSAFLWSHTPQQRANSIIIGLVCTAIAIIAAQKPQVRFANTVLAVWLVISIWALPTARTGTIWNHILVAVALFATSMMNPRRGRHPIEPHPGHA